MLPPDLCIRPAMPADLPRLRTLFLHARRKAFDWQPAAHFQLGDFDEQTLGEQILLAESAGQCLGFISVWTPDRFIHHLYIDTDHARRGLGRALLGALPGWPTPHYQLKCLTRNQRALAFYVACGFIEVGAGQAEDGDYRLLRSSG